MDAKRLRLKHIAVVVILLLMLGTFLSFFITPAVSDARTRKELGLPDDAIVTDTARSPWVYVDEEGGVTLNTEYMIGMDTVVIPDAVNGVLVTGKAEGAAISPASQVRTIVFPKRFSVSSPDGKTGIFWFGNWDRLETVVFEEGAYDLTGVAIYAMPALKEVYLPKSATGLYAWSFNDCPADVTVYYAGTEEEWAALGNFAKNVSKKHTVVFETPVPDFRGK